jgi:hypothetical protein
VVLRAIKAQGPVVREALIDGFVGACRAVHTIVPLQAAVIGEEALVAAALLDLWKMGKGPQPGDPGTLWPDPRGELRWFPGTPISLVGV